MCYLFDCACSFFLRGVLFVACYLFGVLCFCCLLCWFVFFVTTWSLVVVWRLLFGVTFLVICCLLFVVVCFVRCPPLFDVRCLLVVVHCLGVHRLFILRCLFRTMCCLIFVLCYLVSFFLRCSLFYGRCALRVVCCLLVGVVCSLFVDGCWLAVGVLVFVVCCLLRVCCWWSVVVHCVLCVARCVLVVVCSMLLSFVVVVRCLCVWLFFVGCCWLVVGR